MPGDFRCTCGDYTRVLFTCTRGCGCIGHPAFPAPSVFSEGWTSRQNLARMRGENAESCLNNRRHCEERLVRRSSTSEGGSDEAIHSSTICGANNGLLRGACHRAHIRATRWLAMTAPRRATLCAVVPAKAGTHNLRRLLEQKPSAIVPKREAAAYGSPLSRGRHVNRHCEFVRRSSTSEGGSDEAIHSFFAQRDGLLRGACHRARIRATRWLAMTVSRCATPHRCHRPA